MKTWLLRKRVLTAIAVSFVASVVYLKVIRTWHSNWGATAEEAARRMPLEDRIPDPGAVTTRGITVRARPGLIWPWIVQMGERPRAGYYS